MRTGTLLTVVITMSRISLSRLRSSAQIGGRLFGSVFADGDFHRIPAAADDADAAHHLHGPTLHQEVAADVGVAVGQRVLQLCQRDAIALQAFRIGLDLIALDGAAGAGHVDDARHAAKFTLEQPVLQTP